MLLLWLLLLLRLLLRLILLLLLLILLLVLLLLSLLLLLIRCRQSVGSLHRGVLVTGIEINISVRGRDIGVNRVHDLGFWGVLASSKCGIRSRQQYDGWGGVYPGVS